MVYSLVFSSKCSLFHNSNVFGSCIIHILYTGCAKIKKNNSGAKRLIKQRALILSELETLAVVWATKYFRCYLYGKTFF